MLGSCVALRMLASAARVLHSLHVSLCFEFVVFVSILLDSVTAYTCVVCGVAACDVLMLCAHLHQLLRRPACSPFTQHNLQDHLPFFLDIPTVRYDACTTFQSSTNFEMWRPYEQR